MVSLHMKPAKFDKREQGGTSGNWGSYNTWKC